MYLWPVAILVLLVDQLSKWWVVSTLVPGESLSLPGGFMFLTQVHNQGAAFGILQGKSEVFVVCAVLVVAGLILYSSFYRISCHAQLLTGLLVGGALGNFIDRIRLGYVIDFLDLRWWPVFNVADVAIVCGGILLALYFFREERDKADHASL